VTVDLAFLTVLAEQAPENSLPPHPENLGRHTGLSTTLSLTGTSVSSLGLCEVVLAGTNTRVNDLGLDNDVAILAETTDVLPRVGVGDLRDVRRVEVDLAFTYAENRRGEALLRAKVGHGGLVDFNEWGEERRGRIWVGRGRKFEDEFELKRGRERVGRVVGSTIKLVTGLPSYSYSLYYSPC